MTSNREIIGVLSILGMFAVWTNTANAADMENNLSSTKQVKQIEATEVALSVSEREKSILKKYENAHTLTNLQLKELLWAVGFRGTNLKEAWAVAKKESNGRPLAFNGNTSTGDSSYGIFQINMLGILGPDRRDKFELNYNTDLFNPVINAQVAFHMSNGGNDWSAWKGITPRTKELLKEFPN